jgi:hypothetical protein
MWWLMSAQEECGFGDFRPKLRLDFLSRFLSRFLHATQFFPVFLGNAESCRVYLKSLQIAGFFHFL